MKRYCFICTHYSFHRRSICKLDCHRFLFPYPGHCNGRPNSRNMGSLIPVQANRGICLLHQVRNARDLYRPVDHPYLMRFTAHTKVYEIKPIPAHFPQYAYSLATFEVLNTRIDENAYCSGMHSQFPGLYDICLPAIAIMFDP